MLSDLKWRNKWLALVNYTIALERPATMPLTSWNHYVNEKGALLINANDDPVEVMEARCWRSVSDGDYASYEEWENAHMRAENREYWKGIVDRELELITEYFGSDTEGLEKWKETYAKYISYANG